MEKLGLQHGGLKVLNQTVPLRNVELWHIGTLALEEQTTSNVTNYFTQEL